MGKRGLLLVLIFIVFSFSSLVFAAPTPQNTCEWKYGSCDFGDAAILSAYAPNGSHVSQYNASLGMHLCCGNNIDFSFQSQRCSQTGYQAQPFVLYRESNSEVSQLVSSLARNRLCLATKFDASQQQNNFAQCTYNAGPCSVNQSCIASIDPTNVSDSHLGQCGDLGLNVCCSFNQPLQLDGIEICGVSYWCGVPDGVCPMDYEAPNGTRPVCYAREDPDCMNACQGTKPIGPGIIYGDSLYSFDSIETNWSFTPSPSPIECEWGCQLGFTRVGEACMAPCELDGVMLSHGSSRPFYQYSEVPFGGSCTGESRVCSNGVLSGSNSHIFSTCTVLPPASCTLDGVTVTSGNSAVFYSATLLEFGENCDNYKQTRTCTDGSWDGSSVFRFREGSCSVKLPLDCPTATLDHGQTENRATTTTVPYGSTCNLASQTCYNGTLLAGNSYIYSECEPLPPANCVLNGKTVQHGTSGTFYSVSTATCGLTCAQQSEQRYCYDGSFTTGSLTIANCNENPIGSWVAQGWSACSNGCGTGTQTQSYSCSTSCCVGSQPSDSQSCQNYGSCTYSWSASGFGSCQIECGNGVLNAGEQCDNGAANGNSCVPGSGQNSCSYCTSSCTQQTIYASCSDGIQNQGETGVDCGGSCAACAVAPTCSDGIQNQGETGVDCGGPCAACVLPVGLRMFELTVVQGVIGDHCAGCANFEVTGGSRHCQSVGFQTGFVTEFDTMTASVVCFRNEAGYQGSISGYEVSTSYLDSLCNGCATPQVSAGHRYCSMNNLGLTGTRVERSPATSQVRCFASGSGSSLGYQFEIPRATANAACSGCANFEVTGGHRYCQSQGYATGFIAEYDPWTAQVHCFS